MAYTKTFLVCPDETRVISPDVHAAQTGGQTIIWDDRSHTASRNRAVMARTIVELAGLMLQENVNG
ncbi:protein of unknown function [Burkholderia multivorans]